MTNQEIAEKVLSGELHAPYGINSYYAREVWLKALDAAMDTGEWSEVEEMVVTEEAYQTWMESRTKMDFDDWREWRGQ